MLGKFFECEANKHDKYSRVIHTVKEYSDGKKFPIDETVIAEQKVNLNATDLTKMGGCISTYECIFRWLIRGICGYINIDVAIQEVELFCKRR